MNIGALSRLINHPTEIKRPIQVLLIDLSGVEAKISSPKVCMVGNRCWFGS